MLTFRQVRDRKGYYYNVETGEILLNVGPGQTHCWSAGRWQTTGAGATDDQDKPVFEILTPDVLASITSVFALVPERHG